MTVRELLLVRHGERLGNLAAAAADRAGALRIDVPERDADIDLSPRGEVQAAALGRHLAALGAEERPEALWVSTYLRALRTAEIALEGDDLLADARVDERLRDRELGALDALTWRGGSRRSTPRRRRAGATSGRTTTGPRAGSAAPTSHCGSARCSPTSTASPLSECSSSRTTRWSR